MMHSLRRLGLGMLLALLSACSIIPRDNEPIADDQSELVARDLSGALALLRGYSPRNTTLQLKPAGTRFGHSLERALRAQGYGLQHLPKNETGPLLVTYQVETFENASGQSVGYRLRAGSVELAREYAIQGGRVFPMTGLSVRGVEIASQPYDQSHFDRNRVAFEVQEPADPPHRSDELLLLPDRSSGPADRTVTSVQSRPEKSLRERVFSLLGKKDPAPAVLEPFSGKSGPVETAPLDGWVAVGAAPDASTSASPPASAVMFKRNVLDIGQSNFADMTQDYQEVSSDVLIFANNSLRLGPENKVMIGTLAEKFNPATDLLSLLGCSNGPSGRDNGNQHLAIGRANRVKEELILANVSAEQILDEGCWAPTAQEGMPARGVIVRLLRQTGKG